MRLLDLESAVLDIRAISRDAPPSAHPFFFIVGAGLSVPTVKTASQIEEELRQRAVAENPNAPPPPPGADAMRRYAYWFETVCRGREQRRRFLEEKIRGRPIPPAAYRLAHLLFAGAIGQIVVTPNFDDFLSRALTLFDKQHVVCDHPAEADRIDPESPEVQIVHVHGTYWFYDAANLMDELVEKAVVDSSRFTSLLDRLHALLYNRSPIVIGYSGWDRDVIMEALRRRLKGPLKVPLYWFCYNASDVDALPECLRSHPDVRVVVAPGLKSRLEARSLSHAGMDVTTAQQVVAQISASAGLGPTSAAGNPGLVAPGTQGTVPRESARNEELPADVVLRRLVRLVNPEVPLLLQKPLRAFAHHLQAAFPQEHQRESDDVLWFRRVIRRVEDARESKQYAFDEQVDPIVDALVRARPADALVDASRVQWSRGNPEQKAEFAEILYTAARQLDDNSRVERDGYALAAEVLTSLERRDRKAPEDGRVASLLRRARFNQLLVSTALSDWEDATRAAEGYLRRFRAPAGAEGRLERAQVLICLAAARQSRSDFKQALSRLQMLVNEFSGDPDRQLQLLVARALGLRGFLEGLYGKQSVARRCFDRLVSQFSSSEDPELRAAVVSAFIGRAASLLQAGEVRAAAEAFSDVIRRFGESTEIPILREVAMAYAGLVSALTLSGNPTEALETAASAEERFAQSPDAETRRRISYGRANAVLALFHHGRFAEAVDSANALIATPPAGDAEADYAVSLAYLIKVMAQLQLKVEGGSVDLAAAEQTCREAIARFAGCPLPMAQIGRATLMGIHGLLLLGRDRQAGLDLLAQVSLEYASSPIALARQQAAAARIERARQLAGSPPTAAAGLDELRAVAGDSRLLEDEALRKMAAAAAVDVGARLHAAGDIDGALQAFDDVVQRFGDYDDPTIRLNVANAVWNQAVILIDRGGDRDRTLALLDDTIRRTRDVREGPFIERACFALARRATLLGCDPDPTGAFASLDGAVALLDGFKAPQDAPMRPWLALQRSMILRQQQRFQEVLEVLKPVLEPTAPTPRHPLELEAVAGAYLEAATAHLHLGNPAAAFEVAEGGVAYLERAPDWAKWARLQYTPGFVFDKAVALAALDRRDDSISAATEFLQRFGDSTRPELAAMIQQARGMMAPVPEAEGPSPSPAPGE